MRALAYLQLHLLKNGLLSVFTNPKRLVLALFFAAWIGMSVLAGALGHMSRGGSHPEIPAIPPGYMRLGVVALLVLLTLTAIERGLEGAVFSFAAPDYDFLFPTPIPRRLVVGVRLLVDTVTLGLWVGLFVLFVGAFLPVRLLSTEVSLRSGVLLWISGWLYAVFVINFARIAQLVAAGGQVIFSLSPALLRKIVLAAAILCLVGTAYLFTCATDYAETTANALSRPPLSLAFVPMLSVASFITGDPPPVAGSIIATLGTLFVLAGACLGVVCVLDRDVIEATIEHSARVSRLRAAAKAQDVERMAGERLRDDAKPQKSLVLAWRNPSLALVYKCLAEVMHGGGLRWVGWGLLMIAPGILAMLVRVPDATVRLAPGPLVAYILLLVSSFHSLRFRSELNHVALLRTLPIRASRQLLGLIVPRALAYSAFFIGGIVAFWVGHPISDAGMHLATAMCVPLAALTTLLVGAIAACVFPNSTDPAQRFLGGLLLTIGVGLALTPAIVLIAFGAIFSLPGPWLGLLGNLGLLPVAALCILIAGYLFARFQPGDE